jgi:predicted porin
MVACATTAPRPRTAGATATQNQFTSGVLNTSRFGLRGTEAGRRLQANFNLESGINMGTGANSSTSNIFDRRAATVWKTAGAVSTSAATPPSPTTCRPVM